MRAVFVFDGDCGFCTMSAQFIERWIRPNATVVPWQRADLAGLGLTREQCLEAVQWVHRGRIQSGPGAIGAALRSGYWAWRPLGWLLLIPGVVPLLWPPYRLIARYRHRLPGATPACALPPR